MINETPITARYAETEQMGIIHHSVYPVWFEVGRTNFIKMIGIGYGQLEKNGVMLPLSELTCKYIKPVHYEDEVIIQTSVQKLTVSRIQFAYKVLLDGVLMAEGTTTHGFVSSDTLRPLNMKKFDQQLFDKLLKSIPDRFSERGATKFE